MILLIETERNTMSQGLNKNTPSGREVYGDIIDLPHHVSKKHPHMSLYDRAAQFAPFAALSGYDDMVKEEARETGTWHDRDEEELDRKIGVIFSALAAGEHPLLTFTVFVPDERKSGGEYVETSGRVKKINTHRKEIVLYDANGISDGEILSIPLIYEIEEKP